MGQRQSKENLIKELKMMASNGDFASQTATIKQFVSKVTAFSSQYDSHNWSASQVAGPPKVYPKYGDIHGAWAPQAIDANQYLELEFEQPLFVTAIHIYETYHAGGVKAIKAMAADGKWKTLWKTNRVSVITQSRIFSPELSELGCRTDKLRLEVDCSVCRTWVEIDAVQMEGRKYLSPPPPSMKELANDLSTLVNNKDFSDIEFRIEDKTVYAHKAILCARSDYFRAMFNNTMKETFSKGPLELIDVEYDSFLAVLHFLYSNVIPDHYDTLKLTEVWRAADKFSIEGLKMLATFLMSEKIDDKNVVDTYVAATNSFPVIEETRNNCMTYMSTNMNKVVNTNSFAKLPQEIMLQIIQGATAKLNIG